MKKSLLAWTLLLLTFGAMESCQKEIVKKEFVKEITIDTAITAGSSYVLELAPYGDEGDVATVTETASFASASFFEQETDMFTSVYHYTAMANAAGKTDHVTLAISRDCNDTTFIYLNIDIK